MFPEICLILRFGKKFLWDANAPCFLSSTVKVEKNKFAAQGQVLTQLRRGLLQRLRKPAGRLGVVSPCERSEN